MRKSFDQLFEQFSENYLPDTLAGDGDVKYHLGYEAVLSTTSGKKVEVRLAANPSHLEIVDPIVEGKARARQRVRDDFERRRVLPLLIHGDAAFAGQGVVAETLQFFRNFPATAPAERSISSSIIRSASPPCPATRDPRATAPTWPRMSRSADFPRQRRRSRGRLHGRRNWRSISA